MGQRKKKAPEFLNGGCSKRSEVSENLRNTYANFGKFEFVSIHILFLKICLQYILIIVYSYQKLSKNACQNQSTPSGMDVKLITTARPFFCPHPLCSPTVPTPPPRAGHVTAQLSPSLRKFHLKGTLARYFGLPFFIIKRMLLVP